MLWYKIPLSPVDISAGKNATIQGKFEMLFMLNKAPRGAGLFCKDRPGADLVLEFYFSPITAAIAMPVIQTYSGVECPPPARSEVTILVVDASAMDASHLVGLSE